MKTWSHFLGCRVMYIHKMCCYLKSKFKCCSPKTWLILWVEFRASLLYRISSRTVLPRNPVSKKNYEWITHASKFRSHNVRFHIKISLFELTQLCMMLNSLSCICYRNCLSAFCFHRSSVWFPAWQWLWLITG